MLQPPMKKPNRKNASGSKKEAAESSKKAKVEKENDSGVPEFKSYREFEEYIGDRNDGYALYHYQEQMKRECQLKEIRYFLISTDRVNRARIVQSVNTLEEEELEEFKAKKWELNAEVGPYDDYQRLVVWHLSPIERHVYGNLFFSYDTDIAFPKVFEELKQALQGIPSSSDALSTAQSFRSKYSDENFNLYAFNHAVQESMTWWYLEDMKKQMIPILSKFCYEVLKKQRSIEEVANETIGQVVGPCTRAEIYLNNARSKYHNITNIINQLAGYISREKITIVDDEILLEQLVERFLKEDPPSMFRFPAYRTYVDYIELKLRVAKHLGII